MSSPNIQNDDLYPNALEVIRQITNLTQGQDCIFRGESSVKFDYPYSSPLYRQFRKENATPRHIPRLLRERQNERIKRGGSPLKRLIVSQRRGEKTNLLDFTGDKMIALFFACCENLDQDARIVIKQRSEFNRLVVAVDKLPINKVVLLKPPEDLLRAKDQSGVLIHAPLGLLSVAKEETIVIKAELKREVLEYLSDRYDISHGAISAAELDRLITNQIIERDRDSETYDSEGVLEMFKSQHSNPTQFIYELLQNAEDANAKEVRIKLTKYGLDVHHDGDDFSIEDIKGLVSIGFSSKSDDLNKVGQFGVGFKSVFRFTSTPQVFLWAV